MAALSEQGLDRILGWQLTVAWAGEGRCSPRRLGWWDTDLVDEAGGGDFFSRLLPQTHGWASIEAAREAARRVDARARGRMADPDKLRTIFFLGFALDEQLGDRLAALKRSGAPVPIDTRRALERDQLAAELAGLAAEAPFTVVPGGRQLKGRAPADSDALVRRLVAALVPFADEYPLPFYKLDA